ncbi:MULTISPECIES: DUF2325 domain-containing protein [Bacillaceae]|uniref:Dihydroorotate dehydrogenase n=1 Tax=Domibacillus aminovorans TaxID=29332 RepID=A0A177KW87_9BACI|nr:MULTISPECIES: DUF2325 domain-containing protein [Bacillaceae]OAH57417.1 dihydroorotate dehydrogenase [Domibacillus aminovorans]
MTSLLVVGGDKIDKLADKLEHHGFDEVIHVSGRKAKMVKTNIPQKVDLILVLTDYINHNLSSVIKRKANEQSIPICFAKRSWSSIYKEVEKIFVNQE